MESMGRRVLWWVLVLVVACGVVVSPAAASGALGGATANHDTAQGLTGQGELSQLEHDSDLAAADSVHVDVYLHENGTATFTVDYRFENASSDDWQSLRSDVEENATGYTEAEAANWNEVLEAGQAETNREMGLSNVSVTTDESPTPRDLGHVTYTFQWSAFAHVELSLIEAGDALAGFTLADDTTLQFSWAEEYTVREVSPSPANPPDGSVLWHGDETEFTDDQPSVVLMENGEEAAGTTEPSEERSLPLIVGIGVIGAIVLAVAAGWWLRRRTGERTGVRNDGASGSAATTSSSGPEGAAGVGAPGNHPPNHLDGGRAQAGGPPSDQGDQRPPPELLSNEERVMHLLEQRGGRIKQQEVVSELDWTEAKTSQVVTSLREDDEIEVFRVGRENVLALPEADD